jgi:acylphosphatase
MEKTTLFCTAKQWASSSKLLVLLVLLVSHNLSFTAVAQSNTVLASVTSKTYFQTQNTFALKDVLTDIGNHYSVKIAYETQLVKGLSVDFYPSFVNQDVSIVLKQVLDNVNLDFEKVTEKILVVKPKSNPVESLPVVASSKKKVKKDAFDMSVSGVVRDVNNEGVPGVSVVLQGTSKGTVTDMKGAYHLNVSGANDVLIFSSVGMETIKEQVGTRTTIDVVMKDEEKALEMVVVSVSPKIGINKAVPRQKLTLKTWYVQANRACCKVWQARLRVCGLPVRQATLGRVLISKFEVRIPLQVTANL